MGHGAFPQQQGQLTNVTLTTQWHPVVTTTRGHLGRGNELFHPKFCAEGPREAGAPLSAPMEGTFFSAAALLVHTKIL
jgi:hypothetical protein